MDARSEQHNIVPVPAHKHQIRLRAWVGLDRVQKYFGEYFYRETVGFITSQRYMAFAPRQQMMPFVKCGREGGCGIQVQARVEVRPIEVRPIEVKIHGE